MESKDRTDEIPEPLRTVLRDYLHVEWYELQELAADVQKPNWNQRVGPFKFQLREAILERTPSVQAIHALTRQEFESKAQLVEWLKKVWASLYNEPL
jgi:hypothetical protein